MILKILARIFNTKMCINAAGLQNSTIVRADQNDAQKFVRTINDSSIDIPLTQGNIENESITPFYLASFASPQVLELLLRRELKANLLRLVHAGQKLYIDEPVRPGMVLHLQSVIRSIESNSAGELLTIESAFVDTTTNKSVVRSSSEFIVKKSKKKKRSQIASQTDGDRTAPLFHLELMLPPDAAKAYARISGDRNPIHTNYIFARLAGFKKPVLHGMSLLAKVYSKLNDKLCLADTICCKKISCRFSGYVYPGDLLSIEVFRAHDKNCFSFSVKNSSGREVVKNGIFEVS